MDLFQKRFRFTVGVTLLAVVVVILGAYTRLVDAGLGCPDWPGCYGFITVPQSPEHIEIAEERFPDAPVEVEKGWPEMVHRYVAGLLGLGILALAVMAARDRSRAKQQPSEAEAARMPLKLPIALLILVVWQALFGMWTVTLKLWPQVVAVHLLGGFATLSLLFLLCLRLRRRPIEVTNEQDTRLARFIPWALGAIVVVVLQIALGGWTAANYAAYACIDLPTCHGQWWPEMDFAAGMNLFQAVGPNYLGGLLDNEARVAIHMSHRIGAVVTTVYLLVLISMLYRQVAHSRVRGLSILVGVVLLIQILLGLSNVYWHFPLAVAVSHNAVGALLLLTVVALSYYLITRKRLTDS